MKKKKICFLINSMAGGGAERVLSILLKNLSRNDREFFLIVLEDKFNYEIPKDIKVIKLFSNLRSNFKKLFGIFLGMIKLKKIIKNNQIDIVVSFLGRSNYINILTKIRGSTHKAYISERVNPLEMHSGKGLNSIFNMFLTKKLYKKADLIISNSLGIKDSLIKDFFINPEKIKVIYNPINIKEIQILLQSPLEKEYQKIFKHPVIINVARFNKQKGQEYLIKAFKDVREKIPDAKLLFLGEGELENCLKNLAEKLELKNDILFLGWQSNPFKFLARAKVFVFSSLWEGFPNALIEAMVCKVPVISTDCPSGPNEIIENKKSGILVQVADEKVLTKAILKILNNPYLGQKLSQEGKRRAQDFSAGKIIKEYEQLLS